MTYTYLHPVQTKQEDYPALRLCSTSLHQPLTLNLNICGDILYKCAQRQQPRTERRHRMRLETRKLVTDTQLSGGLIYLIQNNYEAGKEHRPGMKCLTQHCLDQIIGIIVKHLQSKKSIIGKWVVSLPEWIELLQVATV